MLDFCETGFLEAAQGPDEHCFGLRDVGPQLPSFHPCYGGVNAGLHGGNEVGPWLEVVHTKPEFLLKDGQNI